MSDIYEKVAKWMLSERIGASSRCIAVNLLGWQEGQTSYPSDSSDFLRCERLLECVPEFRARLGEMESVSKYWKALVPRWEEIRASKEQSKLIQGITHPIQDFDLGTIRLGNSTTLTFVGN